MFPQHQHCLKQLMTCSSWAWVVVIVTAVTIVPTILLKPLCIHHSVEDVLVRCIKKVVGLDC
jgi:hypothetical protein